MEMDRERPRVGTSLVIGSAWLGPALIELERYYWSSGGPAEKTMEDMRSLGQGDWREALAIFYGHYAYERAGAPRSWAPLARELIESLSVGARVEEAADQVWGRFVAQVNKANPANNALSTSPPKVPATRFVVGLVEDDHNLIRWAARRLHAGAATDTNRQLQSLKGIGPKIAAFFLRDVVTSYGIDERSLDDRRAILPVDVWVRRGVGCMAGWETPVDDERADKQIQELALKKADEVGIRVSTLDAGLWVFGARFARSPARMAMALGREDLFRTMIQDEVQRVEAAALALRDVLSALDSGRAG